MTDRTLLILGARSDIGIASAHKFAQNGFDIQLAARDAHSLSDDCSDLMIRYDVKATSHEFDALDLNSHTTFVESLPCLPTVVICTIGLLGSQKDSESDSQVAAHVIRSNYEGPASILGVLANYFEERGSGTLIGISSVAGERGRASNYIYGSAKAGFSAFLSGLRNRLSNRGVHVLTVKPGFVRTKMTHYLPLPKLLTNGPEDVARDIFRAHRKNNNDIYTKRIWGLIMVVIRFIPEGIFKRMKL